MHKFELETWVNFFLGVESQEADISKILGISKTLGEVPAVALLRYMEQWQTPFYLRVKTGLVGSIDVLVDDSNDHTDTHVQLCQDLVTQGVLEDSTVSRNRIKICWTNGQPDSIIVMGKVLPKAFVDKMNEMDIHLGSIRVSYPHRPIIRFRVDQIDKRLVMLINEWIEKIRAHQSHSATGCWRNFIDDSGEDTDGIHYPWHQWLGMEAVQMNIGPQQYLKSRVFDQDGFFRTVLIHPRWLHGPYTRP